MHKRRSTVRLAAAFRIAAGCAMLAAAAQIVRAGYVRFVAGSFAWASRDVLWMAPLAFLGIFGLVAVGLWLAGHIHRRASSPGVVAGVCGALAGFSIGSQFPGMHPIASVILALGVGARLAIWVRENEVRRTRTLGALGLVLGVTLVAAGAAERVWRSAREKMVLAHTPAASGPNVLLIILDTVRRSNMSLYGYSRATTPNIDRLAGESTVFEWAVAPSSWTLPTHAAMFTGRRSGELGVSWREPLDAAAPTLAEALRDRGYATGGFVGNLYYTTYESGLARGFLRYEDYLVSLRQAFLSVNLVQINLVQRLLRARRPRGVMAALREFDLRVPSEPPAHARRGDDVAHAFLEWHEGLAGRPFFAFINVFDAHDRHRVPDPWRSRFSKSPAPEDLYDGGIAMGDAAVGIILDSLRARGALDRTLVVITSDHGEHLGRRGLTGHGNSLYLSLLRVPLLVRLPGAVRQAARSEAPVSLAEFPATVVDVLRLAGHPFSGKSWFAADSAGDEDPVFSEVGASDDPVSPAVEGPMHSLVDARFHFIHDSDGTEELYDLARDPRESSDVADRPEYQAVVNEMRAALRQRVPELVGPPGPP